MRYTYDLHVHSCLSPCGDDDMTPNNIVQMAGLIGYDILALTDHNSCQNCPAIFAAAEGTDLLVLPGMELCTAEEAHVVCLFPTLDDALAFDAAVAETLPPIQNRPDIFGEQRILDGGDALIGCCDVLLTTASSIRVDKVLPLVRAHHGTAFPAHIDRPSYSVTAALGTVPDVGFAAAEITAAGDVAALLRQYPLLEGIPLLLDSDAHYLDQFADAAAWLDLPEKSAAAVIAALDGRAACRWGRA